MLYVTHVQYSCGAVLRSYADLRCSAFDTAGCVASLPIKRLRAPEITFWSVWENGELLGCGAVKELDAQQGEIKSMRTARRHRRKGVASAMLDHIPAEARRRGYRRLSLETGAQPGFIPARQLYGRAGFTDCGPFGDYKDDPNSIFMTKEL